MDQHIMYLYLIVSLNLLLSFTLYAQAPAVKVFEKTHFDMGQVEEGKKISLDIPLKNLLPATIQILSSDTSCGCTQVEVIDEIIEPGQEGFIVMTTDTSAKLGQFKKSITLITNLFKFPIEITVDGFVVHQKGKMVDKTVLFKGECKTCHVGENIGEKTGALLFNSICYMCHKEGFDKKKLTLEEIKKSITIGVDGTSMPGYSKEKKGPLTKEQIQTLVDFISKKEKKSP